MKETEAALPDSFADFRLLSPENSALLDKEASALWGLSPFALVEAAGRLCSSMLEKILKNNPAYSACINEHVLVCAGSGNNGADALVMLREILNTISFKSDVSKDDKKYNAVALLSRLSSSGENTPREEAVKSLQAMGVPVIVWDGKEQTAELFNNAFLIIDGIAGTGIQKPLEGIPLEMLNAVNEARNKRQCCVVSVDIPSGAHDTWKQGMPVVQSDFTLAIQPAKTILYTPALRPFCGTIIPVKGIFPLSLLQKYNDGELLCWEKASRQIPSVAHDAYKYSRGVCEIHAGKIGTAGAARLAAAGASAAGAGLITLVLDDELYPVLAPSLAGIMAVPLSSYLSEKNSINSLTQTNITNDSNRTSRFIPNCLLLGSGWGREENRMPMLQKALMAEESGIPLILDADGIFLLKKMYPDIVWETRSSPVFHGRAILTPHAGELETLSEIPKERLLSEPALISGIAKKLNAVIIFKSHVMIIAAPDGRLGFIDGMLPSLGAGGSGDLLAGLCAGIAGRFFACEKKAQCSFDPFLTAAAAGTLLVSAARCMGQRFFDPLELAKPVSVLAGLAWLPKESKFL